MKSTKVLLIAPSPDFAGGISRWARHILARHAKTPDGIELEFLCQNYYSSAIERKGIRRITSGIKNYIKTIQLLKRKLKVNHYDTLHLTSSASLSLQKDLIILRLARRYGIRTVIHFHFGRIPELKQKNNLEWRLIKRTIKRASTAIVIDLRSYNTLREAGFHNIENLANPISEEVLSIVKKNIETRATKIEPRTITFVGQMLPTKGIYELIEACRKIKNIKLNMYGLIPLGTREELEHRAGEGRTKWLNIWGEVPYTQVIDEMQRCEVFALPTYTEGFPNVILESMAAGCAIVASNVGAIPEMLAIDNKRCGICIVPKSTSELHSAIEWLLSHPTEAQELRLRAAKRVSEEYSMDIIWKRLTEIWKQTEQTKL